MINEKEPISKSLVRDAIAIAVTCNTFGEKQISTNCLLAIENILDEKYSAALYLIRSSKEKVFDPKTEIVSLQSPLTKLLERLQSVVAEGNNASKSKQQRVQSVTGTRRS